MSAVLFAFVLPVYRWTSSVSITCVTNKHRSCARHKRLVRTNTYLKAYSSTDRNIPRRKNENGSLKTIGQVFTVCLFVCFFFSLFLSDLMSLIRTITFFKTIDQIRNNRLIVWKQTKIKIDWFFFSITWSELISR